MKQEKDVHVALAHCKLHISLTNCKRYLATKKKTMALCLHSAYLAYSEVQKSGVSTNLQKKQKSSWTALQRQHLSDQTRQSTLNAAEQTQAQNLN